MVIRKYRDADEREWLRCRVVAFLDCSYCNDVKTEKERYEHPSVSLVAEDGGRIVGLIDVEIGSDDQTRACKGIGAVLWHMAVLPEYRRQGVAASLWREAQARLTALGARYCELWTQEDEAANRFYRSMGFALDPAQSWLRCYARGRACGALINEAALGSIYGPEELVFDAPLSRREELTAICSRIDEVRLYWQEW